MSFTFPPNIFIALQCEEHELEKRTFVHELTPSGNDLIWKYVPPSSYFFGHIVLFREIQSL